MKIRYNKKREKQTSVKKEIFLLMAFLLVGTIAANAQMTLPTDPNIPDAPIDGLLGLGLAAGAVFGIYQKKRGKK